MVRISRIAWPATMRRERRDPEEERLRALRDTTKDIVRLRRQEVGLVGPRPGFSVDVELAVVVELVTEIRVGARIDERVELAPARRDLNAISVAVVVEVLPDHRRVVPGAVQP